MSSTTLTLLSGLVLLAIIGAFAWRARSNKDAPGKSERGASDCCTPRETER